LLIDDLMPEYTVRIRQQLRVAAPPERVYRAAMAMTIRKLPQVRLLLWLREFPSRLSGKPLEQFPTLAEDPNRERVMAICGRFWAFHGNILDIPVERIPAFQSEGYGKAYWNFTIEPVADGESLLASETRVQCYGESALKKFRVYWFIVGPFAVWIRWQILRAIAREASA
jgi:hypothetical protein